MRTFRIGLACVLIGFAAGCVAPQKQYVATYTSPKLLTELPGRIVVIPFDGPMRTSGERDMITESVALEVQAIPGCAVIIASPDDERLMGENAMGKRGRVDIAVLIAARKRYRADAFLFGTVTHYKPYDPPVLGLNLRILSASTGEVLWAAEGLFDAHDQAVRKQAENYFTKSGLQKTLYGPDLIFMSPRLFSKFAAGKIISPLQQQIPVTVLHPIAGK